jgi:(2Fe-2S) ferredoxin
MSSIEKSTECRYIFICANQKAEGKKCCAAAGAEEIYLYLKSELIKICDVIKDTRRIKAVKTSCLGHCAFGPNIYIVPDNIWYSYVNKEDVDEIIQKHFVLDQKAERLINTNIPLEIKNLTHLD